MEDHGIYIVKKMDLRVFNFAEKDPSHDDIHNFWENIEFLNISRRDYVLLAPSYMICNIDYKEVLKYHREQDNDITIVYKNVKECRGILQTVMF